jgi:hypothetical protein
MPKEYKYSIETVEDIETKFGMSLTDLISGINSAVQQKYGSSNEWISCIDVLTDAVVIERNEGYTSVAWAKDENNRIVLGEETEVKKTYVPTGFADGAHEIETSQTKGGDTSSMSDTPEIIEREAKIFEAGSYPDKDIEVTEAELDNIINGFQAVPIKVEHEDSPLKLGSLTRIWRKGKELFGMLAFPKPAFDLLQYSGAQRLSSAIKRDKSGISEVSIVRHPRVADAAYYSLDEEDGEVVGIRFESDLPAEFGTEQEAPVETEQDAPTNKGSQTPANNGRSDSTMSNDKTMDVAEALKVLQSFKPSTGEAAAIFDASNAMLAYVGETEAELKATAERAKAAMVELQRANCDRLVDKYTREGKITPAVERFARAILNAKPLAYSTAKDEQVVSFKNEAGEEMRYHFAEVFVRFLEELPPVVSFQEMAKQRASEDAQLSGDEMAWLEQKLGLSKESIKQHGLKS